jgi:hypothetical protein
LKVSVGRNKQQDVNRADYNETAGVETPVQPELPACAEHVWHWWWELNARRPPGFDSLAPITYGEIDHWISLTRKRVTTREINWLTQMDNAWMTAIATERKDRSDRDREEAERNKGRT